MSHSVKFSWFLSEFTVLKVEIEDRNLVQVFLRKIPGSVGKNIDFRFNYTPECMVSSMHFFKFSGKGLTQPLPRLLPAQSRAAPSIQASPSIHPSNIFINPSPNRRGQDHTVPQHWTQNIVPRLHSWNEIYH